MSKMIGVYIIRHPFSGTFYIGSSGDYASRRRSHLSKLRENIHGNKKLQVAFNIDRALTWELIPTDTVEEARALEYKMLKANYENQDIANYHVAQPFSDEHIAALSKAHTGREMSKEHRAALSRSRIGSVHAPETIKKMSVSRIGKPQSADWADKRAESKRLKVSINGDIHRSAADAATALSISYKTVLRHVRSTDPKFIDWKFAE